MKLTLLIALVISLSGLICNTQKDEKVMREIVSTTAKATNGDIRYFNVGQIKSTVRYYLICEGRVCTKEDQEIVRQQATLIEHKYNIPCYEVGTRGEANMIVRLK